MTDRLSLTNALADANIERQKAERIATEIFDAIHDKQHAVSDLQQFQGVGKYALGRPSTVRQITDRREDDARRYHHDAGEARR